ncbi:MAG: SIR2 family protein [Candidatus Acidiferrales bacterium]
MVESITDRNVYVLGAGASADAGAPLIKNFLDCSRNLLDDPFSGLEDFEREHFRQVFHFRRAMAQAREKVNMDLDDIEQLFGLAEMSHRLQNTSESLAIRNSMVYVIAKTLQSSIDARKSHRAALSVQYNKNFSNQLFDGGLRPFAEEPERFRVDCYDFFAGLASGVFDDQRKRAFRKDTIITFNYDLVVEHALRRYGIEADYGLDNLEDKSGGNRQERFHLLKLHGSTNWGICASCKQRIVILPEKVTDSPSEFRNLRCSCRGTDHFVPLLIPPSWDKSGYADIIAPIWSRAVHELKSATRICIIGYSIPETDAFFKYLLTMALAENHQLYKMIVVDYVEPIHSHPASLSIDGYQKDLVEPRYLKLLDSLFRERRFLYFNGGFMSFLCRYWERRHLGRGEMLVNADCF